MDPDEAAIHQGNASSKGSSGSENGTAAPATPAGTRDTSDVSGFLRDESNFGTAPTTNSIVYDNIDFGKWEVQGGRLVLVQQGLLFFAPPGSPTRTSKLKIRWQSVIKHKIPPRSNPKFLLKLMTKMKGHESIMFQFPSRESLEDAAVQIHLKLEASQPAAANKAAEANKTQYTNVSLRGHRGAGRLVLDDTKMVFINANGMASALWEWNSITKHKINNPTHDVPLLRIKDTEENSFTFQMKNRMDLQRIKQDIQLRLGGEESAQEAAIRNESASPNSQRSSAFQAKTHGSNRRQYKSVTPTLGSFARIVGPAADVRELEYISALHQNAEDLVRSDGTISSQDIPAYLMSRYGLEITSEQAIDIAQNLCGGKPRNEFSAELDAHNDDIAHRDDRSRRGSTGHGGIDDTELTPGDDDEEEEEPVFYFDLVQVMSLLMIPELRQLADDYHVMRSKHGKRGRKLWTDLSEPISFKTNEKLEKQVDAKIDDNEAQDCNSYTKVEAKQVQLSNNAVGIFKLVLVSLLEIFDEELQDQLKDGAPVDADVMITILESFGDMDAANDPVLVQQMLDALRINNGPPMLKVENFISALTSDINSYQTAPTEKDGAIAKTSTFYDIFGYNWDEPPKEEEAEEAEVTPEGNLEESLKKGDELELVATSNYIDYAVDTYRSAWHNTAIWSLFILTTLVYLHFFIQLINSLKDGLICSPDRGVGCSIGNTIVGWILIAMFSGLYGMFFVLPTSMGNVYGNKKLLWANLPVTFILAYVPFSTLMWYHHGIPHSIYTEVHHRVICPGWTVPEDPEEVAEKVKKELEETGTIAVDETKMYLVLDSFCSPIVDWCQSHPEVQGKYLDEDPERLSDEEFEVCYDWVKLRFIGEYLEETGGRCNPNSELNECPGHGPCALPDLTEASAGAYVCCHGTSVAFPHPENVFGEVCDGQPIGAPCLEDRMCESRSCVDGKCALGADDEKSSKKLLGEACDDDHEVCLSGFCLEGTCKNHPKWCPIKGLELLGGVRMDPFCRTEETWCEVNNWVLMGTNLFGLVLDSSDASEANSAVQTAEKDVNELEHDTGLENTAVGEEVKAEATSTCEAILDQWIEFNQFLQQETGFSLAYRLDIDVADKVTVMFEGEKNIVEESLDDPWPFLILICIAVFGAFAVLAIIKGLYKMKEGSIDRGRDYSIKCAASHKIADVIENALGMHALEGVTTKGQAMRTFFLHGEKYVEVGGLPWTLRQILSRKLFYEEGVRFTGRLWIGQAVQVVVTLLGMIYSSELVKHTGQAMDDIRDELGHRYTKEELLAMSPYEWSTVTIDDLTVSPEEKSILERLPERWMIDVAGTPAIVVGCLVALFCILVYVPSYTNTVLKLRNGTTPSLRDPFWHIYRQSPDNVVQNIGNMVFSLMGAGVFSAFLVFVGIFVFVYPQTRQFVLGSVIGAIGVVVTIAIKIVGQKVLRSRNFSSFYRKKPSSANYANLFFECWYLGTGLLVVTSRLVMFIVTGAFWLGRIDVEFLHPHVKIAGIGLDAVPAGFTREILAHEAHLHPYIERLGGMYLMRIRDGDRFGSVAGTTWRCLFVSGLMPWIVKYKVNVLDEDNLDETEE